MTEGKYRLERRLGGGGMAEVFTASVVGAEGFSRRVAIKRVLPGFCDNPHFAKMFVAEVRLDELLKVEGPVVDIEALKKANVIPSTADRAKVRSSTS